MKRQSCRVHQIARSFQRKVMYEAERTESLDAPERVFLGSLVRCSDR